MRLCANTGCALHLIQPLGFTLDEKRVKRAGLDYRDLSVTTQWTSLDQYLDAHNRERVFAYTTKASRLYTAATHQQGDSLLFGPETRGLPASVLNSMPKDHLLRIPMRADSRSLNLSNTVAIACYEAWKQLDFAGS